MAADPVFVDTNVLVYANQKRSAFHVEALALLERAGQEDATLWISRQVLREYLATVTRPQGGEPALSMLVALERVHSFATRFEVAEDGPEVFSEPLELLARVPVGGKQVHDANLVATMLAHGVTRLLSFNVADFRRFGALVDVVGVPDCKGLISDPVTKQGEVRGADRGGAARGGAAVQGAVRPLLASSMNHSATCRPG